MRAKPRPLTKPEKTSEDSSDSLECSASLQAWHHRRQAVVLAP
jgi:hypothetical protein